MLDSLFQMLDSLKPSDWIIAFATLAGPILAVQAQKFIERATERKRQRFQVFSTLMVTRGTQLAPEHVSALNSVELIFSPSRLPWRANKDTAVIEAFRLYVQHLNIDTTGMSEAADIAWTYKAREQFIQLLLKMATAVGFKAERERLQTAYLPKRHHTIEQEQLKVLNNAAKVLAGEQPLPMAVVAFPFSQEATDLQQALQKALLALVEDGTIRVSFKEPHK